LVHRAKSKTTVDTDAADQNTDAFFIYVFMLAILALALADLGPASLRLLSIL
jgi:hypothetical protein